MNKAMGSESTWDETPVQEIVAAMVQINSGIDVWNSQEWREEYSLWANLAANLWSSSTVAERMYLYLKWTENFLGIKDKFCSLVEKVTSINQNIVVDCGNVGDHIISSADVLFQKIPIEKEHELTLGHDVDDKCRNEEHQELPNANGTNKIYTVLEFVVSNLDIAGNDESTGKELVDALHVGLTFSSEQALHILNNPGNVRVHTQRPKGDIQMNSVYVFDTTTSDIRYWMNDQKSWKYGRLRPEPFKSDWLVMQRQYTLLHKREPVDCFRNEIWSLTGDKHKPSTWCPPRVLVYYHGSFPVNGGKNADHGNIGKRKAAPVIFNRGTSAYSRKKANSTFDDFFGGSDDDFKSTKKVFNAPAVQSPISLVPGFTATPKATILKVQELLNKGKKPSAINRELNLAEIYDDNDEFQAPRNKKQIQNTSQGLKRKEPCFKDDLTDVYAFALDHPEIIRKMELIPGLFVSTRHPELESHFHDLYKVVPIMVLYYDTTFNLGERFVSILAIRHPGLLKKPVYPLQVMYHEYTDQKFTHSPFFRSAVSDFKNLNTKKSVIVTDREGSIKAAISEILPNAVHIFCYLHILKNIDRWTASKGYSVKQRKQYHYDIKQLLWSESVSIYETMLDKFRPDKDFVGDLNDEEGEGVDELGNVLDNQFEDDTMKLTDEEEKEFHQLHKIIPWDDKFQSYYKKYLDSDLRKSFRGAVVKYGIFNKYSGITTNPAESMNSLFQNSLIENKKPTLYSLINTVYDFQTSQLIEIQKGLWMGKGNRLDPEFEDKRNKLKEIDIKHTILKKIDFLREPTSGTSFTRFDAEINYPTKKAEAWFLYKNDLVNFVRDGKWMVTEKRGAAFLVNFPHQTCDCKGKRRCVHVQAVNMANGVDKNPNFDNINHVTETSLTEVHTNQLSKKVGKKRGGNRVKVEYESPAATEIDIDVVSDDDKSQANFLHDELTASGGVSSSGNVESSGPEIVTLPVVTKENAWKTLIEITPRLRLTLYDLKLFQDVVPIDEMKYLRLRVNSTTTMSFIPHWLNNFVIESYLHKLVLNSRSKYLSTWESSIMADERTLQKRIQENWGEVDFLLFPIHINGNHWCLGVASLKMDLISCFNSKDPKWKLEKRQHSHIVNLLNKCLGSTNKWPMVSGHCMQQPADDAENCGLITLANSKAIVQNVPTPTELNMSKFRQEVLRTIIGKCDITTNPADRQTKCRGCEKDLPKGNKKCLLDELKQCNQCKGWWHFSCSEGSVSSTMKIHDGFTCV